MASLVSTGLVLAADPVNPTLAMFGQIAAIIICLFLFIFVVLALVINLVMAFGLKWLHDKTEAIKLLRPSVESLNKQSAAALQNTPIEASDNALVRNVSQLPKQMQAVDHKVEQASDRVARAVIEYRARTVQAKTIVKAFLMPAPKRIKPPQKESVEESGLEFKSPGYRMLMEKQAPEVPVAPETQNGHEITKQGEAELPDKSAKPTPSAPAVTASQPKNVPAHR